MVLSHLCGYVERAYDFLGVVCKYVRSYNMGLRCGVRIRRFIIKLIPHNQHHLKSESAYVCLLFSLLYRSHIRTHSTAHMMPNGGYIVIWTKERVFVSKAAYMPYLIA